MAFFHGKKTAVFVGPAELTRYFNEASVSRDIETAETTAFGDDDKTYIIGLKDGTLSTSGMFDGDAGAVDEQIATTLGADAADVVTVGPEGPFAFKVSYSCAARKTSYEVSSPVGDVVAANLSIQADGGVDRGVILAARKNVSASGDETGFDAGGSSSDGGVGYLHVTENDHDDATVIKVQHSVDDLTYVDLVTFASVPASTTTAERVEVAGTVNQYVRASHAPGGSSGSVTYTLAFARK
jgi:hypothetical protein